MVTTRKKKQRRYLPILTLLGLMVLASSCGKSAAEAEEENESYSQNDQQGDTDTTTTLSLIPSATVIQPNGTASLKASGGTQPYAYSISSAKGTLSQNVYTATSQNETAVLQVTDSKGGIAFAYVEVKSFLELKFSKSTIKVGETATLSAAGGVAPYTFTVLSGVGSISGKVFSAGPNAGESLIEVSDAEGNTAEVTIKVKSTSPLSVSPQSATVRVNKTLKLTATGGVTPYRFDIYEGLGDIAQSGLFTAPDSPSQTKVRVVDAEGTVFYINLTTVQSQLSEDCVKQKPVGLGGSSAAYGQMGKVNNQDVCILPVASRFQGAYLVQNDADIACPAGFSPLMSGDLPYTITVGQYYSGQYTGMHNTLAAKPRECVEVCTQTGWLFGKCKKREMKCSVVSRIACYK